MGIAWDGDFDRCFLFDERGQFIEGYYVVGLLAEAMLARSPGARIVHDPRLVWNTREIVRTMRWHVRCRARRVMRSSRSACGSRMPCMAAR